MREPVDVPATAKCSPVAHSLPITQSQTGTAIHPQIVCYISQGLRRGDVTYRYRRYYYVCMYICSM